MKKSKRYLKKYIFNFFLLAIVLVFAIYFHISTSYFFVIVEGNSMLPSFKNHQILYFSKKFDEISLGNMVVFKRNGETYIKRITGIPGGYYLRGPADPLSFAMVAKDFSSKSKYYTIETLKNDEFFAEGDNKSESFDSNSFGPIKRSQIIGKLFTF